MSRAKTVKIALPMIALVTSVACASSPDTSAANAQDATYQDAIEEALRPASAEERAFANRSDPLTRASFWASEYQKDAANLETTLELMRALRAIGSHDRVLEIAGTAVPIHPDNHDLYLEIGRTFLTQGKYDQATQALVRSADLSPPTDAAPLAVLGLAFDRMGEHEKAQTAYQYALDREPDRATTLSNYGLSLALTGQLEAAESALRRAVVAPGADVRVRQNLALILGLQGRFDEMRAIDPNAPPRSIEANQRALQQMMAPTEDYSNLQNLDVVIDRLERTPAAEQEMPGVPEAMVESESMQEPMAETLTPTGEAELAGDGPQPQALRPTLRGSQGR